MTEQPVPDGPDEQQPAAASTASAEAAPGGGSQPRRQGWRAPLRWLAKRYCRLPPKPPEDAEMPSNPRWREDWPAPLRCIADNLYPVPWDPPLRFPERIEVLREHLATSDDSLADELLADAQRLFDEADARIDSVERRATTLQGTVAIAALVALTGGALVVDPSKIHGAGWRTAFAVGLAVLVLLLVLTTLRATGASSRTFSYTTLSDDDIFKRAKASAAEAKTRRAAYLLHGYGRNNEVAAVKVDYLYRAAIWFRWALAVLLALIVMVAVYVIDRNGQGARSGQGAIAAHPTSTIRTQVANNLSGIDRAGIWLIAIGAFLVALAFLWQGVTGGLSGRPVGPIGTRRDRVLYSIGLTGALLVGVGSVIAAIQAWPALGVVIGSIAAVAAAVWLFAACRLHIDNRKTHKSLSDAQARNSSQAEAWAWDARRYSHQMQWRWCLTHPFVSEADAKAKAVEQFGERPDPR